MPASFANAASTADADVVEANADYLANLADYRDGFRRYLSQGDWPEWADAAFFSAEEQMAFDASVMSRLYADGWNRYGWPADCGGFGGTELHRAVYYEELGRAMLPIPAQHWTLETLGPALIKFAPDLAKAHLVHYLNGTEWWGQSFSEPEAGSDLASLRTRAVVDDDGLVINGQKIWTSQGPTARRLLVLVRTGPSDSRHRGLTMLMVDADTPGVTVRPIALASGRRELAEVFFEDVRVPADRIVGDLGGGWAVAMYLMQFERGMYGYAVLNKTLVELGRLRADMLVHGASQADRERFASAFIDVTAARARTATTVGALAAGHVVGPQSSVDKVLFGSAEKAVNDLVLDLRGQWMIAAVGSADPAELDTARAEWWYSRAATVMGGTVEVQRQIIADHLLKLPKERR